MKKEKPIILKFLDIFFDDKLSDKEWEKKLDKIKINKKEKWKKK